MTWTTFSLAFKEVVRLAGEKVRLVGEKDGEGRARPQQVVALGAIHTEEITIIHEEGLKPEQTLPTKGVT